VNGDSRPLSAAFQHDLEHGYSGWLASESKDRAGGKFSMPAFLVKQKLIADVSGNVRRVYEKRHTNPSLRSCAMVRTMPSR
jgi:hypothetical protein